MKIIEKLNLLINVIIFFSLNPKKSLLAINIERVRVDLISDIKPFNTISLRDLFSHDFPVINFSLFLSGGSTIMDYLLLIILTKRFKSFKYKEIGTWMGESISNVLSRDNCDLAISVSLDLKNDIQNIIINTSDERFFQYKENSLTFDFTIINEKFDLIFIDGDHSYESIKSDTTNAIKLMKDSRSVIVWHDYSKNNDEKVREISLKAIRDSVPKELHEYLYYVENTMCCILIKERFNSNLPKSLFNYIPTKPKRVYSVKIVDRVLDNLKNY